jgi:hypothetical protein
LVIPNTPFIVPYRVQGATLQNLSRLSRRAPLA